MRRAKGVSKEDAETIYHADTSRSPFPATGFEVRREPKADSAITLIVSTRRSAKPTSGTAYILSPEDALRMAVDLVKAVRADLARQ